jgi:hypothetical protein
LASACRYALWTAQAAVPQSYLPRPPPCPIERMPCDPLMCPIERMPCDPLMCPMERIPCDLLNPDLTLEP